MDLDSIAKEALSRHKRKRLLRKDCDPRYEVVETDRGLAAVHIEDDTVDDIMFQKSFSNEHCLSFRDIPFTKEYSISCMGYKAITDVNCAVRVTDCKDIYVKGVSVINCDFFTDKTIVVHSDINIPFIIEGYIGQIRCGRRSIGVDIVTDTEYKRLLCVRAGEGLNDMRCYVLSLKHSLEEKEHSIREKLTDSKVDISEEEVAQLVAEYWKVGGYVL